ncbi:GNAT family N-acetyltransferase [Rhodoblastus sp. 17X3]|uniref:GNAT family N-acetyltransferase n=1 Tax=Rhodoblastus sp. 17X3 TaxID=3047026 RepID=UPI0024B7B23E|nr:GNAT family N-acetyltransferase [Rhodoblastus sp. 17X3]MDI9847961.1 GNAT family N-acetyltransferase [Rhodoblastus sp. 17X3]
MTDVERKEKSVTRNFLVRKADLADVRDIASMVGALLSEIVERSAPPAFDFDLEQTEALLADFLREDSFTVFVAETRNGDLAGFISLNESRALYANGRFGTIAEFYVRPLYRSHSLGRILLAQAKTHGREHGWSRLEVTTPPLPTFDQTLAFYEREDFVISGGRKLKTQL